MSSSFGDINLFISTTAVISPLPLGPSSTGTFDINMASNFMWQDNYCFGCVDSYPHLCRECRTTLDRIIGFEEIMNTAVDTPGQTISQTKDLRESPSSYNPFQAWKFQETISLPMQAFEASYRSHTELRGFESTATASYPRYIPSSAGELDPHLIVLASENASDLPDTDPTYQGHFYPSHAVNLLHIQAPSPSADQSSQFRCDHPSRQSPDTVCGQSFKQNKDLDRHIRTVHAREGDSIYQCSCQYNTARKDNYMRHLRCCTVGGSELRSYACICGFTSTQKTDHVTHLGCCGGNR